MEFSLYNKIKKVQDGSKEELVVLIDKFKPLINKLSRKLNYEESQTDLIITFIETIESMKLSQFEMSNEGSMVNYICKILNNRHIDLFRKNVKDIKEEIEINLDITRGCQIYDIDSEIFIRSLLDKLPENQKKILEYKYINDYSDIQIGEKMKITRQAVNRSKNRGLENLRSILLNNY